MMKNTETRWGWMSKLLHWLMFLLIAGAYVAVNLHETYPEGSDQRGWWMMMHKAFGLSVFLLVWWRLAWRATQTVPENFAGYGMARLASLGHALLYVLMIAVPLSALLMSQFAGRPVSWFGVFEIPVWLETNRELAGQIKEVHAHILAPALFVLILLHIGGALWHHIIDRDDTLKRMLPFWRGRGL